MVLLCLLNLKLKSCFVYKAKWAILSDSSWNQNKNYGFDRSKCLCKGQVYFSTLGPPTQIGATFLCLKCFMPTTSSFKWKKIVQVSSFETFVLSIECLHPIYITSASVYLSFHFNCKGFGNSEVFTVVLGIIQMAFESGFVV